MSSNYRPVQGPIDRDSFFAAQVRHRRAAAWLGVLAACSIVLVGFPLAAILFPMLFAVAALLSMVVAKLLALPDLAGALLNGDGFLGMNPTTASGWLGAGIVVCPPGVIAMLVLWRAVWRVLATTDPSAIAANLGVRLPRSEDSEERQLENVVEEISIAAGLAPPRVMMMDDTTINIAALGATPHTAALLVTRGLLDRCSRDETQALIADAIAAIGNGDLRATLRWIAVSVTLVMVRLILQAPYSPPARERLAGLRALLWAGKTRDPAADAATLARLMADPAPETGGLSGGRIKLALTLPFFMAFAMFNAVAWFSSMLFLSPALTLLLRRRRYLADAIAVQLTRNPDSLVSAFNRLISQPRTERTIPLLLTLLFVAAPPNKFADHDRPLGFFFGSHPALGKRHQRVARMGLLPNHGDASQFAALAAMPAGHRLLAIGLLAVLLPLVATLVYLMLYLIVVLTAFSLVVGMIYVSAVILPLRWVLFG